jgi:hypothetical protein
MNCVNDPNDRLLPLLKMKTLHSVPEGRQDTARSWESYCSLSAGHFMLYHIDGTDRLSIPSQFVILKTNKQAIYLA